MIPLACPLSDSSLLYWFIAINSAWLFLFHQHTWISKLCFRKDYEIKEEKDRTSININIYKLKLKNDYKVSIQNYYSRNQTWRLVDTQYCCRVYTLYIDNSLWEMWSETGEIWPGTGKTGIGLMDSSVWWLLQSSEHYKMSNHKKFTKSMF